MNINEVYSQKGEDWIITDTEFVPPMGVEHIGMTIQEYVVNTVLNEQFTDISQINNNEEAKRMLDGLRAKSKGQATSRILPPK